jgi:four helix bundle protein
MSKIERFEDLEVWKKAIEIGAELFLLTKKPPLRIERDVNSQLIRAALSISNNIAEGFEYDNRKDFIKFLRYAKFPQVKSEIY